MLVLEVQKDYVIQNDREGFENFNGKTITIIHLLVQDCDGKNKVVIKYGEHMKKLVDEQKA